tara:strand:- start:337 stop:708 length:372 start_codon:yes stop_codon:yes gene_type:complete
LEVRRDAALKEIKEARAAAQSAGMDSRSVDALTQNQIEETKKRLSRRTVYTDSSAEPILGDKLQRKDFGSMIKAEVTSAGKIQKIREQTKERAETRALRFIRGNASLLTSSSGGAGFLSGYFK